MAFPDPTVLLAEAARHPFTAGLLGAVVSLKGAPGKSWWERCFNVLCGGLIAGYLSPGLASWLELMEPAQQSALSFVCGMVGMTVVSVVLAGLRRIDVKAIIESWTINGGTDNEPRP
ncbi:MAG: hypothetical protein Alpg2KO_00740 [Alphaproteobacteria bacterium]